MYRLQQSPKKETCFYWKKAKNANDKKKTTKNVFISITVKDVKMIREFPKEKENKIYGLEILKHSMCCLLFTENDKSSTKLYSDSL